MRVACFSFYDGDSYNAEGLVTARCVNALRQMGHDVEVFTEGTGKDQDCWLGLPWNRHFLLSGAGLLSYGREVWSYVPRALAAFVRSHKNNAFDCIVSRFEPSHSCVAGYLAKLASGLPWIVSVNDPMPRQNPVRRSWRGLVDLDRNRYNQFWGEACLTSAEVLVFPTRRLCAKVLQKRETRPDVSVIEHIGASARRSSKADSAGGKTVMVRHVGFLSKQRDIGTLADALIAVDRLIEEHSLTVEFVGDVRAQAEEIRKVKSAGLRNVHVKSLGVVSPAEAADLIATADAGLLVEEEADVGVFLPSKFCDYVACGCPVIAIGNKDSAVGDLIQEFACGVLIEHGDVSGCVAGLLGVMKRQWTASDEAAAYFGPARVGAAWDLLIRRTVQVCLPWARLRNTA